MVALLVTLDTLEIKNLGLNFNEYLTLVKLQHDKEKKHFPYELESKWLTSLQDKGFISLGLDLDDPSKSEWLFTDKGNKVFEGEDMFEEFYELFPHRVETPMGFRAISAKDPGSLSAKTTRSIWKKVTKNKPNLQKHIIECLKRELEHRKMNNSMAYLQGINTWLRQATWEKWEDIPDENMSGKGYTKL